MLAGLVQPRNSMRRAFGRSIDAPTETHFQKSVLATVVLANALEFFDYFAYTIFAKFITRTFFPYAAANHGLLLVLGTFAAGFLSRPIGALLIGTHADRAGRKPALLLTSALATAGSLSLAVIPGFSMIGIFAPAGVLLCRVLQGVAIGGEMGSSGALLIENCRADQKCLYAGWLMAGQGLALLAAGVCGLSLYGLLSSTQIERWGWRVPFLVASSLIPVQIYLRRNISERWQPPLVRQSAITVISQYRAQWLVAAVLIFGGTVPTYVASFTTMFGVGGTTPSTTSPFFTTAVVGSTTLVLSVVGGLMGDLFGRTRTILFARGLTMVFVLPAFGYAASHANPLSFAGVIALFAGLSSLAGGPIIVAILEMFPVQGRALSMSIVYSIGVALFGGSAPFVVASANSLLGIDSAAGWYVFLSAASTFISIPFAVSIGNTASTPDL